MEFLKAISEEILNKNNLEDIFLDFKGCFKMTNDAIKIF